MSLVILEVEVVANEEVVKIVEVKTGVGLERVEETNVEEDDLVEFDVPIVSSSVDVIDSGMDDVIKVETKVDDFPSVDKLSISLFLVDKDVVS